MTYYHHSGRIYLVDREEPIMPFPSNQYEEKKWAEDYETEHKEWLEYIAMNCKSYECRVEGLPEGACELNKHFVLEDQFWTGSCWWPTYHLVSRKGKVRVKPGTKTRTVAVAPPVVDAQNLNAKDNSVSLGSLAGKQEGEGKGADWQERYKLIEDVANKLYKKWAVIYDDRRYMPIDCFTLALQDPMIKQIHEPPSPTDSAEGKEDRACPCLYLEEPCHPRCTCTMGGSSTGCMFCCTYGSLEQRKAAAKRIAQKIKASSLPAQQIAGDAKDETSALALLNKRAREDYSNSRSFSNSFGGLDNIPFVVRPAVAKLMVEFASLPSAPAEGYSREFVEWAALRYDYFDDGRGEKTWMDKRWRTEDSSQFENLKTDQLLAVYNTLNPQP